MNTTVSCLICGKHFHNLRAHFTQKHNISVVDYQQQYGGPVFSEYWEQKQKETAQKARDAKGPEYRHSKETIEKMKGPRPSMHGVKKSVEHRQKLSEARKKIVGWKHAPETIAKMKGAWAKRKEDKAEFDSYRQTIRDALNLISREESFDRPLWFPS